MSVARKATRTQVWMESLGDWSWPGTGSDAEVLPPSWVPAFPPRLEPLAAHGAAGSWQPRRTLPRNIALGALLSALASISLALALKGPSGLERLAGYGGSSAPAPAAFAASAAVATGPPLPTLGSISSDEAGSLIVGTNYASPALRGTGSFLVYLPPGYASTNEHYPVLYLLHGNSQPASAFLQIGVQGELDRLIAQHVIPPMIAVMIQGGPGANNWRGRYESYVLEVQQLVDRMLPTVPSRDARAIAGDSMGGFGAMNIALGNPYRFGVVESWLGFFNGLGGELHAARPVLSHLGLHAFVYGAASDRIADPSENGPFAAALRAEGARATGVVYPGDHSLETVESHLGSMLTYVGRALAHPTAPAAARPTASAATAGHGSR
jgi:S-formylglutathione hydrolase FrmB